MKRYTIEILEYGFLPDGRRCATWKHFYSAPSRHTERAILRDLNTWRNVMWDLVADKPIFRAVDNKTGRVIDQRADWHM